MAVASKTSWKDDTYAVFSVNSADITIIAVNNTSHIDTVVTRLLLQLILSAPDGLFELISFPCNSASRVLHRFKAYTLPSRTV